MLLITAGAAVVMVLLIAALSIPHKAYDYGRTDVLTGLTYVGLVGLAFLIDPFPGVVGKDSLYIIVPSVATLLCFAGLKLEQALKNIVPSLIVVPVLAALIAPIFCLLINIEGAANYQPPRPHAPMLAKVVNALSHKRPPTTP